ncbi:MAG: hypothetical protein EU539_02085 [Promethearchaeota archaeon]|nr:MAG: hypothetical protein EU539_02085 [Candidatus Lokiarchaeota archaeon]
MLFTLKKIKRRTFISIILLILIIFELYSFSYFGLAKKDRYVSGYSKKATIKAGETIAFKFSNNLQFEIKTGTEAELNIDYNENLKDRQISVDIDNENLISLNVRVRRSLDDFGVSDKPSNPKKGNLELQYNYYCIYRIQSNETIDKVKFEFDKDSKFNLDPLKEYSIAVYEEDEESWKLLNTEEVSDDSNVYLLASMEDIEPNTDYYITIYEIGYLPHVIIFTSIIIAVGIISLVILISKKDFIHYLKTRSTYIQKGAHRLTLDEVLENENRNKIIDLILEEPGIHFNELLRRTELAPGNLVWHLDILETYKIIGKKRITNFVAYFPYYQKNPISNIDLKLSKSKLTLEILEMIEEEPGIYNNIITKRKKVDHKTIQYHIHKLLDLKLINSKKEGRKKKLYPNLEAEYFTEKNHPD